MRPPTPAVVAIVLLALSPVHLAYNGVWHLLHGEPIGFIPFAFVALWVLVLRGLWQGGNGAYKIAIVIAVLVILSAFAAGAAIVVPWSDFTIDVDQLEAGVLSLTQLALGVAVLLLLLGRRSRAFYALR